MKAVKLTIKNIGIIGNIVIDLNKPLMLFYGDLRQGKTTILNAFKWCLGGSFPSDIIKHGETEASVSFEFSEDTGPGSISRSWYINKDGVITARPVQFIRAGKPVPQPDKEIKKFLNPYLLDNNFLKEMGETERKAYFVKLFGVDTTNIDKEINDAVAKAHDLRIKIKSYGEIDLTEVKPVDVTELKEKRQKVLDDHENAVNKIDKENQDIRNLNSTITTKKNRVTAINTEKKTIDEEIKRLNEKKHDLDLEKINLNQWLNKNESQVEKNRPALPDTSDLDNKISEAAAVAVKVEQYQKNLKRADEKKADEKSLSELEATQRDLKKKKVAQLVSISEKSGINGLVFAEDGSFTFKGTASGMLSTSQIMELSQELSALYPSGFGLDLIDRAESLGFGIGKNISEFVDKAKKEKKTILATIVGEKPAKTPPEVGVFVVEKGQVRE